MMCSFLRPTATLASPCPTLSLCRVCADLHGSAGRTQLGRQSIWRRFHLGARPLSWIMLSIARRSCCNPCHRVTHCIMAVSWLSLPAQGPCKLRRAYEVTHVCNIEPPEKHMFLLVCCHMLVQHQHESTGSPCQSWSNPRTSTWCDTATCSHVFIWDILETYETIWAHLRLEKMDEWMEFVVLSSFP
jgi:hypothetical protein